MGKVLLLDDTSEGVRNMERLRELGYDVFAIPRADADTLLIRTAHPLRLRTPAPVAHAACHAEPHAATRWARAVVPIIDSPEDIRTIVRWSRWIGVSPAALRSWCAAAGIRARHSLVFGRLLRATALSGRERCRPEDLLDVIDQRTLSGLMKLAGLGPRGHLPRQLDEFLACQTLVLDVSAVRQLKSALEERRLVGV